MGYDNEHTTEFVSWCIEEYAFEKHVNASIIAKEFSADGTLDYLFANAEILHTQGRAFILSEIETFRRNHA